MIKSFNLQGTPILNNLQKVPHVTHSKYQSEMILAFRVSKSVDVEERLLKGS